MNKSSSFIAFDMMMLVVLYSIVMVDFVYSGNDGVILFGYAFFWVVVLFVVVEFIVFCLLEIFVYYLFHVVVFFCLAEIYVVGLAHWLAGLGLF